MVDELEEAVRDFLERAENYPDGRLRFWAPVNRLRRIIELRTNANSEGGSRENCPS